MISINNLIRENWGGSNYLYHFTRFEFIHDILQSDKLIASVPDDIISFPKEYPETLHSRKTVSLTMRSDMESFGDFRIRLNADLLESDYDLIEFADPSLATEYEREVVVTEDIQPLSKYIVDITCLYNTEDDDYITTEVNRVIDDIEDEWGDTIDINVLYDKGFYDG